LQKIDVRNLEQLERKTEIECWFRRYQIQPGARGAADATVPPVAVRARPASSHAPPRQRTIDRRERLWAGVRDRDPPIGAFLKPKTNRLPISRHGWSQKKTRKEK
jgi:hypothetical protein